MSLDKFFGKGGSDKKRGQAVRAKVVERPARADR